MSADLFVLTAMVVSTAASAIWESYKRSKDEDRSKRRIEQAESKVLEQPGKVKPAWDLARVTLEAYFSRNLSQISSIFWLSVIVMLLGFSVLASSVVLMMRDQALVTPAIVAGVAGVLTQFIGATFLFIYKSCMSQAIEYSKTLERINAVGMAMQILDSIPDDTNKDSIKSATKASVVTILMQKSFERPVEKAD